MEIEKIKEKLKKELEHIREISGRTNIKADNLDVMITGEEAQALIEYIEEIDDEVQADIRRIADKLDKPEPKPTQKAELGDKLCQYCTLVKKGIYGVNGGFVAGCEGSRCDEAYDNFIVESKPERVSAEEYCKRLDEEMGEQWSNDYDELPKYMEEYARQSLIVPSDEEKLQKAVKALKMIANWNDSLEDEWGDPGEVANHALKQILKNNG